MRQYVSEKGVWKNREQGNKDQEEREQGSESPSEQVSKPAKSNRRFFDSAIRLERTAFAQNDNLSLMRTSGSAR
jgi:hypothetical protein